MAFGFFHDAGLTQPAAGGTPVTVTQDKDGATGPVDKQLWFGETAVGQKAQANSNPGVDTISVLVYDANVGGGEPATAIKLAATQGGLAAATPGASLDLGVTQVLSGVGGAVNFWLRITDATGVSGSYTDVRPRANQLLEGPQ